MKTRKCHNLGFCPSTVIKTLLSSRSLCFLFLWVERKTVKEGGTELHTGGEVVVLNDCKQESFVSIKKSRFMVKLISLHNSNHLSLPYLAYVASSLLGSVNKRTCFNEDVTASILLVYVCALVRCTKHYSKEFSFGFH